MAHTKEPHEHHSLAVLIERHDPHIRRMLQRLLRGNAADAADVAQDLYLRLCRQRALDTAASPLALLYGSIRNCLREYLRRRAKAENLNISVEEIEQETLADAAAIPERRVQAGETLQLFEAVARELPPQRQRVVVMHKVGQMTCPEIAAALKITLSTVEQHLTSGMSYCRRRLKDIGALAVLVAIGFLVCADRPARIEYATQTGKTKTVTFEDGSVAYLNTRTRLAWTGNWRERSVVLETGEAFFEVVPAVNRPFRVRVGTEEIQVLGTRFNVYRKAEGSVAVTVLDGTVIVQDRPESAAFWKRTLHANQKVVFTASGVTQDVHSLDVSRETAWRRGVLHVNDASLSGIADELNRYTQRRIVIADPRVKALRVGGSFSLYDIEGALTEIEQFVPVSVEKHGSSFVLEYRPALREDDNADTDQKTGRENHDRRQRRHHDTGRF